MAKITVLYGSSRTTSNTELLTKRAIDGLDATEIYLRDFIIKPIVDGRHEESGFDDVDDDYNAIIKQVDESEIIIFSTPIYWYSMSGLMKNFIDRWSQTLRDSSFPDFKENMSRKKSYVIAVGGDDPHMKGLAMIDQFRWIFQFVSMSFGGYIIGAGNKPEDVLQDEIAMLSAKKLNELLKETV
ncbi:flavodoxin family protein [Siminovitchia acidinfaciens]|uniref:Flavodoxin family protein n=1 Tax=Siminovitchia acidinfaciens TaxID=2321395 RepID=A0A429XX11_9BACI|nr:flavodoxin family protein [Siminovitchia acidinfaciens]RST73032.1 flavodoxin family protein [Siminovitchia acidinfaciens]